MGVVGDALLIISSPSSSSCRLGRSEWLILIKRWERIRWLISLSLSLSRQILGLILPNLFPALFSHLIVMNTGLAIGKLPSKGWVAFRDYMQKTPDVDVGGLLSRGTPLTAEQVDAYRAPFQGVASKAGVRRFPVSGASVAALWPSH
jgi:hypothetical protein